MDDHPPSGQSRPAGFPDKTTWMQKFRYPDCNKANSLGSNSYIKEEENKRISKEKVKVRS
jgi:hypothetical protein